jgi:hypothetical protein
VTKRGRVRPLGTPTKRAELQAQMECAKKELLRCLRSLLRACWPRDGSKMSAIECSVSLAELGFSDKFLLR